MSIETNNIARETMEEQYTIIYEAVRNPSVYLFVRNSPSGDIHNEWEPVLVKALDDLLQLPEHLHPAFFAAAAIYVDVERPPVLDHAAAHVSDPRHLAASCC